MPGRVHHVRAVVLGDVERVDPDSIGQNRFLDGVTNDDITAECLSRLVHTDGDERIQPEFKVLGGHLCVLACYKPRPIVE